jgi:maleylpyruvate isomerase
VQLYSYFSSSATYRVRIALALKGLVYDYVPVHLVKDGGQQLQDAYRAINPTALMPTLVDGSTVIAQSLAIMEYLEEVHPQPSLLPDSPGQRAWVRSIAQSIACDIHPLNNLRVLKYLKHELGIDEEKKYLVSPLGRTGLVGDRGYVEQFKSDGPVLLWRYAGSGGHVFSASGCERPSL